MTFWDILLIVIGVVLAIDLLILEPRRHGMKAFWRI
jgi:hypothetical protein